MPFCPHCGNRVDFEEKYCSSCGETLGCGGVVTVKKEGIDRFPGWAKALLCTVVVISAAFFAWCL